MDQTETDIAFLSQRRFFQQTVTRAGVKSWGYLFTQSQPNNPPYLGGTFHPSHLVTWWLK
jgi:hypothetical protein